MDNESLPETIKGLLSRRDIVSFVDAAVSLGNPRREAMILESDRVFYDDCEGNVAHYALTRNLNAREASENLRNLGCISGHDPRYKAAHVKGRDEISPESPAVTPKDLHASYRAAWGAFDAEMGGAHSDKTLRNRLLVAKKVASNENSTPSQIALMSDSLSFVADKSGARKVSLCLAVVSANAVDSVIRERSIERGPEGPAPQKPKGPKREIREI